MATAVIVGGGVIGCAVAERLSRDRHRVLLLERDWVGAHASGSVAGVLDGQADGAQSLSSRSFELYPDLVERIERASGVEVEYRRAETITPALDAAEERVVRRYPGRWLDAEQALAEEPGLGPRMRGASVLEQAQVTPPRLVQALARAAAAQGAEIREGAPASGLAMRSGRLQGVLGPEGVIRADAVVLAAGPWSATLTSTAGVPLQVRPSRGHLVVLRPPSTILRRILHWHSSYLVPKPDGTIVAGGTEEDVGFDARPTAERVQDLLDFAVRAVPALGQATVASVFAALRPATPDGRPVIGPASGLPGLLLACGHNRDGILLAPLTAELIAGHLSGS